METQCACGLQFGFFSRRHHCRACGNAFCHSCSDARVIIPKSLVEDHKGWWREGIPDRVCKSCHMKIIKFEAIRGAVRDLYKDPPSLSDSMNDVTRFYFNEMERIKETFSDDALTPAQILFIKKNASYLVEDKSWLLHVYKVEPPDGITILDIWEAVSCIIFPEIFKEIKDYAYTILDLNDSSKLIPYIPVLIHSNRGMNLLIDKAKDNQGLACSLYWTLNVISDAKSIVWRERLLLSLNRMMNLRVVIEVLDRVNKQTLENSTKEIKKAVDDYVIWDPFDPSAQIIGVTDIKIGTSSSTPVFVKYVTDMGENRILMYKREYVRKD